MLTTLIEALGREVSLLLFAKRERECKKTITTSAFRKDKCGSTLCANSAKRSRRFIFEIASWHFHKSLGAGIIKSIKVIPSVTSA